MRSISLNDIRQIAPCTWEIPRSFRNDMRVNARLYASREMIDHLLSERALEQLVNTATLPGVQEHAQGRSSPRPRAPTWPDRSISGFRSAHQGHHPK